jgi:hypothetical protein
MIANYMIHHQYGIMLRDARDVDLLERVLKEMVAVGAKTGRWSVQTAIDGARQQLEQQPTRAEERDSQRREQELETWMNKERQCANCGRKFTCRNSRTAQRLRIGWVAFMVTRRSKTVVR